MIDNKQFGREEHTNRCKDDNHLFKVDQMLQKCRTKEENLKEEMIRRLATQIDKKPAE